MLIISPSKAVLGSVIGLSKCYCGLGCNGCDVEFPSGLNEKLYENKVLFNLWVLKYVGVCWFNYHTSQFQWFKQQIIKHGLCVVANMWRFQWKPRNIGRFLAKPWKIGGFRESTMTKDHQHLVSSTFKYTINTNWDRNVN